MSLQDDEFARFYPQAFAINKPCYVIETVRYSEIFCIKVEAIQNDTTPIQNDRTSSG